VVESSPTVPGTERSLPAALGSFAIEGVLGEGGSAVVYAARLGELAVALKVPKDDGELSDREAERFLEEARMLARVRHGSVVEVLDSGRLPDGRPYLAMRRYEGETLAEHLAREGALPLDRALVLFAELTDATSSLHAAGLLHRDIKPENVFLIDRGRSVKLLDFGIAKDRDAPASTTTQAGIARGTPATMAPERFFGAAATELTDVYELAVVLYAMLVGRLPWPDATNVNARLNPLSPIESGARVPEALSSAIMRALSTRPERRPRSVAELWAQVSAAARGPSISGRVTADTVISEGSPPESGDGRAAAGALTGSHRSDGAHIIDSARAPSVPPSRRVSRAWIAFAAIALAGAALGAAFATGGEDEPVPARASEPAATALPPAPSPNPPPSPEIAAPAEPDPAPGPAASDRPAPPRTTARARPPVTASAPPPIKPGPTKGKPKGAPCTRSNECASMLCAAETCQ
jgi:serine/threonine-protein kinase